MALSVLLSSRLHKAVRLFSGPSCPGTPSVTLPQLLPGFCGVWTPYPELPPSLASENTYTGVCALISMNAKSSCDVPVLFLLLESCRELGKYWLCEALGYVNLDERKASPNVLLLGFWRSADLYVNASPVWNRGLLCPGLQNTGASCRLSVCRCVAPLSLSSVLWICNRTVVRALLKPTLAIGSDFPRLSRCSQQSNYQRIFMEEELWFPNSIRRQHTG